MVNEDYIVVCMLLKETYNQSKKTPRRTSFVSNVKRRQSMLLLNSPLILSKREIVGKHLVVKSCFSGNGAIMNTSSINFNKSSAVRSGENHQEDNLVAHM